MNEDLITELIERGVSAIYPNREFLADKLRKGQQMTIYHGIDPTGPTLHLGHSVQLKKLAQFQALGHKVILLIGDFTATIGDPTGKFSTRKMLTHEDVMTNAELYKKQSAHWLNWRGENKAELRYNSKWLAKMNLSEFIKLASNLTVDQLLERDMFKRRREEGKPIFLHEFFYPVLQGFDSVAMGVDGELGGNDQTFNMLTGRDLSKTLSDKEKFVLTTKLLEDNTGKKMGKTEGNMIALNEPAEEMFGKVMSWSDGLIMPGYELCTNVSKTDMEATRAEMEKGGNPRDAKLRLALEIVKIYHGARKASAARKNFVAAFSGGAVSADAKETSVPAGALLIDVALSTGSVSSKSEFRRLLGEGAVKDMATGEKISDPAQKIESAGDYRIGKHRFLKITVK